MKEPELRIRATLLSGKPRPESVPASLLAGMVLVFVAVLCWRDPALFGRMSASRFQVVGHKEYWRLLSAIGVHADLAHLGVNMVFVLFFGYLLYGYFGVWVYPAAMLILAAMTNLLSLLTYPPDVALIGASGLVYVMMCFWLVLYALVERTLPFKKRLLRISGIALIVLVPTTVQPEVSYRTHFIGCGVGAIAGVAYFLGRRTQIRSVEVVELEPPDEFEDSNARWL
jgi:rhomboid protease GluP